MYMVPKYTEQNFCKFWKLHDLYQSKGDLLALCLPTCKTDDEFEMSCVDGLRTIHFLIDMFLLYRYYNSLAAILILKKRN